MDISHGTGYSSARGNAKMTKNTMLLHPTGMQHLSKVLPRLEEADLSGQCELGLDGWGYFIQSLKQHKEQGIPHKLKKLSLRCCKFKEETKSRLVEGINIYHPHLEIDFGDEQENVSDKGRISWFRSLICSNA